MKELATILIKTRRGYVDGIKEWSIKGGHSSGSGLWASPRLIAFECNKELLDLFTQYDLFIVKENTYKSCQRFRLKLNRQKWLITYHRF